MACAKITYTLPNTDPTLITFLLLHRDSQLVADTATAYTCASTVSPLA